MRQRNHEIDSTSEMEIDASEPLLLRVVRWGMFLCSLNISLIYHEVFIYGGFRERSALTGYALGLGQVQQELANCRVRFNASTVPLLCGEKISPRKGQPYCSVSDDTKKRELRIVYSLQINEVNSKWVSISVTSAPSGGWSRHWL